MYRGFPHFISSFYCTLLYWTLQITFFFFFFFYKLKMCGNLVLPVMISIFLATKYFLTEVHTVFEHNAHNTPHRLQYSKSIIFLCLGNQKIHVTHFIMIFTLLWFSETKLLISLRYTCTVFWIFIFYGFTTLFVRLIFLPEFYKWVHWARILFSG